jgi:hypothetical protein
VVGAISSGASPHRPTRAPARAPSATRPSTDAAATVARTGASSDHRSEASPVLGAAREPTPLDEPRDSPRYSRDHVRHILVRQPPNGMKPHVATGVHEHTVQHERVQMDVQIQRSTKALDDHHGSAATIGNAVTAGAAPEEPEHRPHGHAADRTAQVVIPRPEVPQPVRQAETHWRTGTSGRT